MCGTTGAPHVASAAKKTDLRHPYAGEQAA